jgi:hypothetical protein
MKKLEIIETNNGDLPLIGRKPDHNGEGGMHLAVISIDILIRMYNQMDGISLGDIKDRLADEVGMSDNIESITVSLKSVLEDIEFSQQMKLLKGGRTHQE